MRLPWEGYDVAFTSYLGVSGGAARAYDGVLYPNSAVRLAEIVDGASQTVAVGERPTSPDNRWGWWYTGLGQSSTGSCEMVMAAAEFRTTFRLPTCPRGPYQFGPGSPDNMCDIFHFWSRHPGGAHFLFADGSARFLSYSAAPILPSLATRAGSESVTPP